MSLSDLVQSREDASEVGHAMLLAQALIDGPPEAGPRTFCYATTAQADSVDNRKSIPFGARFGVRGVGVIAVDSRLHAAILQYSEGGPASMGKLAEATDLHSAVKYVLRGGFDAVADAMVLRVSEPEFEAVPGDTVSAALTGTAGAQLSWGNGLDGIFTAGHVGKSSGAGASVAGTKGSVVLALDPTNHGKPPEADVAVVQLPSAVQAATRITWTTTAAPGDSVTVTTRGGATVPATIMGQLQWLWLPNSQCTCGHVYMTTAHVTRKGDSGAPVLKSGGLVGHVIGASVGVATYIQLIDYQLQEIRNQSGFSSARL